MVDGDKLEGEYRCYVELGGTGFEGGWGIQVVQDTMEEPFESFQSWQERSDLAEMARLTA